jgi:hypothetical protein
MPISQEKSMSRRTTKAVLVLIGVTIASQALADQPQPPAPPSYWQNLKRQLTAPAIAPPVQRREPAVTSVRG